LNSTMMMKAGTLALCLLAAPAMTYAQTMQWTNKGYITVSGGGQVGSHDLTTTQSFDLYGESAQIKTAQTVKGGGIFDIGAAYRVWGNNLLAGVSFTHSASTDNVDITGTIPDPRFFGALRNVTTSQANSKHSETGVHIDAIYMIPIANKLDVGVFGGPSIYFVSQDSVGNVTVTEPTPTLTATMTNVSKTEAGFNFGADVQYLVYKTVAVGVIARYAWADATIEGADKKLTVGGFQIGGGVRLRF
jgi:Outer membrane protein beta-barrel domain